MKKKYIARLFIFILIVFATKNSDAGFIIRANQTRDVTPSFSADEANYVLPHHGHHSHGGHSHHSYHSHGSRHHYAEHYHHYHIHYRVRHEAIAGQTDYAGLSILFDILGLIPIAIFSVLGIIYGAKGMKYGMRRQLAKVGMLIGVLEIIILVVVAVALLS